MVHSFPSLCKLYCHCHWFCERWWLLSCLECLCLGRALHAEREEGVFTKVRLGKSGLFRSRRLCSDEFPVGMANGDFVNINHINLGSVAQW
ncbi:hypothetical protein M758_1G268000 [Ceratodon purpureus]|uniref:Uncharacterized protein n=1 Tax=Ceratodon purpureus TaxID=3225 RepID=A0A8T0JAD8_CERPU|nr:hypothetical protein KC19_1G275700 [Ceratodon purpureus]KAG0592717.1 hypothetical protein KC19_1G275900 [Ceratodon purpureus]KAG0631624.1 hypothetical protein M758_1G267800 [Ceratodon purpureus]KAG0631626.1 hypothetical protein M758_1G268000 [Ceratodon purpureus]